MTHQENNLTIKFLHVKGGFHYLKSFFFFSQNSGVNFLKNWIIFAMIYQKSF